MTNNVNGNISYNMINNKTEINIVCKDCGDTPKPDEWSQSQEGYCYECADQSEKDYWEDYAQRKMAN